MNQFDKHNIITFKQGDTSSINDALIEYQNILNSGKAFIPGFMGMFDVEFKIETASGLRRLQTSDTNHTEILKRALIMGPESNWTTQTIADNDEIYISEPIFFAIALEHEDLLSQVVETAKAIVSTMRHFNNTDNVWIDDMRLFGVEALYLLAQKHPEYTYLLGHFFIPYWDLEHAVNYETYLYSLVKQRGWTRDLIKAFIWCDNGHFRNSMSIPGDVYIEPEEENQPLGEFLKENKEEYEWFKQAVSERFKQEPVLLYSEDDEIEDKNPVVELFISLFNSFSEYDDDDLDGNEELLQNHFITDTLENEAFDLQDKVAAEVKGPLARYNEKAQLEREQSAFHDRPIYKGDGVKDLKEFILALTDGECIWNYIESGENEDILNSIKKTELIPIAKDHAKNFYFKLTYTTNGPDYEGDIPNQLDRILNDVTYDLVNDEDEEDNVSVKHFADGLVSKIKFTVGTPTESNNINKKEQYLRVLDIFFRLLNVKQLNKTIEEIVTDEDDPILSEEEFYQRYTKNQKAPKKKKLKLNGSTFGSCNDEIDYDVRTYIDRVIAQNGREALDCSEWGKPNGGRTAMAAYLASLDRKGMVFDVHTQALLEYIGDGPWQLVRKQLKEYLNEDKLSKDEMDLLTDYLTTNELKPQASEEEILKILRKSLQREECYRGDYTFNLYNEQQPGYSLFRFDDGFQHMLLCCFWIKDLNPPMAFHAKRLFQLFAKLAPQRVIRQIGKFYSDDYSIVRFDDLEREENFYKELEKGNLLTKEQIYAFQMSTAQNTHTISEPCIVDEYITWLDIYDNIDSEATGMFAAIDKNKAIALEQGMHYINERNRIKYYTDLSVYNERFPFDQPKEFERCLLIFLQLNSTSKNKEDALLLKDEVMSYLKGDIPYDQICKSFKNNIAMDLDNSPDDYRMYSLGQFIWQLEDEMQKRLIKLLVNHCYRGYRVLEDDLFYHHLRQLVAREELSMEEYLELSPDQRSDETEEYMNNAYDELYDLLIDMEDEIRQDYLTIFLLKTDTPCYKEYLVDMVRENNIEDFLQTSTPSQRIDLLQLLKDEPDAEDLVIPFVSDSSRKVQAVAKSIILEA